MEQLSTLNGIAYARTVDSMDGHALLGNLIGDQPRNLQEAGLLARIDGENLFMNARAVASNHSLGAQATRFNEAGVRYAFDNGITLTAGKRIDRSIRRRRSFRSASSRSGPRRPTSTTATAMSKARRSSKRNGPANRPRCSSSPEKTARCAATSTTATCRARRNSCAAHTTGRAVRPRCSRPACGHGAPARRCRSTSRARTPFMRARGSSAARRPLPAFIANGTPLDSAAAYDAVDRRNDRQIMWRSAVGMQSALPGNFSLIVSGRTTRRATTRTSGARWSARSARTTRCCPSRPARR